MKAKQMFFKLGYVDEFQDNNYLIYTDIQHKQSIIFDLKYKTYTVIYDNDYMEVDMELHKSICKKIEELNW